MHFWYPPLPMSSGCFAFSAKSRPKKGNRSVDDCRKLTNNWISGSLFRIYVRNYICCIFNGAKHIKQITLSLYFRRLLLCNCTENNIWMFFKIKVSLICCHTGSYYFLLFLKMYQSILGQCGKWWNRSVISIPLYRVCVSYIKVTDHCGRRLTPVGFLFIGTNFSHKTMSSSSIIYILNSPDNKMCVMHVRLIKNSLTPL